ncbi:MAG TPA: hypothetical protein VK151_08580 [Fluviicola sp.]|nr:hypothetical protein [Fluviicola sp.]
MKNIATLLLLASLTLVNIGSCVNNAQDESSFEEKPLPTKAECTDFINFFVKEKVCSTGDSIIVSDRDYVEFAFTSEDSSRLLSKVSALSDKDIIFIKKQLSVDQSFRLSKITFCPNAKIVSADSIIALKMKNSGSFWNLFHEKYGDGSLVQISKPVFSIDRSFALVRYSKMRGELSGSGGLAVYERVDDKWVFKLLLNKWVA